MIIKYGMLLTLLIAAFTDAAQYSGPTLFLDYQPAEQFQNPVDAFMYFVPLNSLSGVRTEINPNTTFTAGVVNWQYTPGRKDNFTLSCDFEITGAGLYTVTYDPAEMIDMVHQRYPNNKTLTNLLDWIRFEGDCKGRIEASGCGQGNAAVINEVTVSFTRDGSKSPVVIAIYDVSDDNRQFRYADKINCIVARVNTLTFKRSEKSPRMGIELASLKKANQSEGWFSSLTAMLANLVLPPMPISEIGHHTMLDFGLALYQKKSSFTFPVAKTLRPPAEMAAQASAF